MILATFLDVLVYLDGIAGFFLGLAVGWWAWRHKPVDRKYIVDLRVTKPDEHKE